MGNQSCCAGEYSMEAPNRRTGGILNCCSMQGETHQPDGNLIVQAPKRLHMYDSKAMER